MQPWPLILSTRRGSGLSRLCISVFGHVTEAPQVLQGIARGCWIVSPDWIVHSEGMDEWQAEDIYELKHSYRGAQVSFSKQLFLNALQVARTRSPDLPGIFNGLQVYVPAEHPQRIEILSLVTLSDGQVNDLQISDLTKS